MSTHKLPAPSPGPSQTGGCSAETRRLEALLWRQLNEVEAGIRSQIESAVNEKVTAMQDHLLRRVQEHLQASRRAEGPGMTGDGSLQQQLSAFDVQEICKEEIRQQVLPLHSQAQQAMEQLGSLGAAVQALQCAAVQDCQQAIGPDMRNMMAELAANSDDCSARLGSIEGSLRSLRQERSAEREFMDAMYKELSVLRKEAAQCFQSQEPRPALQAQAPRVPQVAEPDCSDAKCPESKHGSPDLEPSRQDEGSWRAVQRSSLGSASQQLDSKERLTQSVRSRSVRESHPVGSRWGSTSQDGLSSSSQRAIPQQDLGWMRERAAQSQFGPASDLFSMSTASVQSSRSRPDSSTAASAAGSTPDSTAGAGLLSDSGTDRLLASLQECQAKSRAVSERYQR